MALPPKAPLPPSLQAPVRPVRPIAQHVRHVVLQAKIAAPGSSAIRMAPTPGVPRFVSLERPAPPGSSVARHVRDAVAKPLQAKLATPVLQMSVLVASAGVGEEKKGGGGGGKRPPLPSQEDEFLKLSKAKGIVVTHGRLAAARFQQMGGGAGWLFQSNGIRIHAWGNELPGNRFYLQGFTDGQHEADDRTRFLPGDGEFEKIFGGFGLG
jgi:hypothetical protein